jgi:hypothetical protein
MAKAYCESKGWEIRLRGDELQLKECPYCFKPDYKFFLNDADGRFLCHHAKCAVKGGFFKLQRDNGDLTKVRAVTSPSIPARGPRDDSTTYPLSKFLEFEINLSTDKEMQDYLAGRGITMDTAREWHLGSKVVEQGKAHAGQKCLMMPFLIAGEQFADIKYRGVPEKWFTRLPGHDSILYGEHKLAQIPQDQVDRPLYIVEGEIDAMTM